MESEGKTARKEIEAELTITLKITALTLPLKTWYGRWENGRPICSWMRPKFVFIITMEEGWSTVNWESRLYCAAQQNEPLMRKFKGRYFAILQAILSSLFCYTMGITEGVSRATNTSGRYFRTMSWLCADFVRED